jgi:predicted metal-binding protein
MNKPDQLVRYALETGADAAVIIPAGDIVVNAGLAGLCRQPGCPNYGLSVNCPPHVGGPHAMKKLLRDFRQAVVFRMDVPGADLFSGNRRRAFQRLHKIAAGIEQAAVVLGFVRTRGYAGGSCRELFCHDYEDCAAFAENGRCRFPQYARPSMSGFGIDVAALFKAAGWALSLADPLAGPGEDNMANICGLVLIG